MTSKQPGRTVAAVGPTTGDERPFVANLVRVLREEFGTLHPIVSLNRLAALAVPHSSGYRVRGALLRAGGWDIDRTTMFARAPMWSGSGPIRSRLSIGADCWINVGCHFELNDNIALGNGVAIGQDVLIMTSTHHIGRARRRAGKLTTAPVTIGDGAWIGARSVLLPGVTVGRGAIVSAGAVVNADVAPNSVVAGVPASVVVPRLPG